jgi:two-component system, OmpR family, copper resistance phosphate regulon response regulator CusR
VSERSKILIVEDDEVLARFLKDRLSEEGSFDVRTVHDGSKARQEAEDSSYRLVVLDLNLPGVGGLEVLQHIRRRTLDLPVIIVTGVSTVEDRVKGLNAGADDYLAKPFSFKELEARIRALLRRRSQASAKLKVSDLELDRVTRLVQRGARKLDLSPKEFDLLEYLMLHADTPVPRTTIFEQVWKAHSESMTNVVDVYVNYLRRKIDGEYSTPLIRTVRGVGYQLGLPPLDAESHSV